MTPEPRAMTPEPKPFSRRQLLKGAGAEASPPPWSPFYAKAMGPWTAWPVSNRPLPPALMALPSRCI